MKEGTPGTTSTDNNGNAGSLPVRHCLSPSLITSPIIMYFSKVIRGKSVEELDAQLGGFLSDNPGIEIRSVTQSESVDLADKWNITMSIIYTSLFPKFGTHPRATSSYGDSRS